MKENNQKLPALNYKILQIIKNQFNNNVSLFAQTIGIKQQTIDRLFKIDSRTGKFPSVSGKTIVAITSNVKSVDKDWLLREEKEGGNKGAKEGGNLENESLNNEKSASTDVFPADAGNGCKNCQKLEGQIFFLQDTIKAKNLTIAEKEEKIDSLNRQIGRLEGENERLREEIAHYSVDLGNTGS